MGLIMPSSAAAAAAKTYVSVTEETYQRMVAAATVKQVSFDNTEIKHMDPHTVMIPSDIYKKLDETLQAASGNSASSAAASKPSNSSSYSGTSSSSFFGNCCTQKDCQDCIVASCKLATKCAVQ